MTAFLGILEAPNGDLRVHFGAGLGEPVTVSTLEEAIGVAAGYCGDNEGSLTISMSMDLAKQRFGYDDSSDSLFKIGLEKGVERASSTS